MGAERAASEPSREVKNPEGKSSEGRPRFVAGLLLVALSASAFAAGFRWSLARVLELAAGAGDIVAAMSRAPIALRILLPAIGGLLAGALGLFVRGPGGQSGQGVGGVMEAVVLGRVRLSMRATLIKSAASWFAIGCGGSIGREGPLIQFGGASGRFFADRLGLELEEARILIAAGTAAGFAAAYNTPFAAVLFVIEVVTGVVVLDLVLPALIATVIAAAVTRAFVGEGPIYGQRAFHLRSDFELLAFVGLGLVTALASRGFMRMLDFAEGAFDRSRLGLPWKPALGGLLAGGVVAVVPAVAGNGYEPLSAVLDERFAVSVVVLLLAGKVVATIASVSSGIPGGVFTPTLLLGGAAGMLYEHVLAACGVETGSAGGYALVGMAAASAATTHAPLMAAVMVFELSGDYAIVLPLILATGISTLLSRRLGRDSIYGAELGRRGIRWEVTMEGRRIDGGGSSPPPVA